MPEYGTGYVDMALDSDAVAPLQPVGVLGMPEGLGAADLYAEWWSGTGPRSVSEAPIVVPVLPSDDGFHVIAPLIHPDGGPVSMAFTDGEAWSPVHSLDQPPLPPPREGAVDSAIGAADDLLRAATEATGRDYPGTWERVRDGQADALPPTDLPLFRAWSALADPQNDASLASRSFDTDAHTLLERLLAVMPIATAMEEQAAWIDSGESLLSYAPDASDIVPAARSTTSSAGEGGATPTSDGGEGAFRIEVPSLPIDGPEELATQLEKYNEARRLQRSLETFDETVGAYLRTVILALSLVGGPAGAGARLALNEALNAIMNLVAMMGDVSTMARWFLPCCIEQMAVELDPPGGLIPYEDAEPNQVRMVNALGSVESEGVDFVRELAERVIERGLSAALGPLTDELGEHVHGAVAEALYGQVTGAVEGYAVERLVEEYIGTLPRESIIVFVWDDTDLAGEDPQRWLTATPWTLDRSTPIVTQDTSVEDAFEFRLVTPAAFYSSWTLIRFQTNFDALPTPRATRSVPIELAHIEVDVQPRIVFVGEDDIIVPFEVTVRNSILDEPALEPFAIDPPVGEVVDLEITEGNTRYFEYHIPDTFPDDTIVEVRTKSAAQGGIRSAAGAPDRAGALFLTKQRVLIDVFPTVVCLREGETQQFQALEHLTGSPVDAVWEASAGTITDDGLFTAPGGGGEVTITASPTNDALSSATGRVILDTCDCFWSGRVSAPLSAVDAHADIFGGISLKYDADAEVFTGLFFSSDHGTHLDLHFDTPIPMAEDGPTVTTARTTGFAGDFFAGQEISSQLMQYPDQPPPPDIPSLLVELDRRERYGWPSLPDHAVALEGRIVGPMGHQSLFDLSGSLVTLEIQFSAAQTYDFGGIQLNCQMPL